MNFDAITLARGWRAVAVATGSDPDRPVLYRTVIIEEFRHGVQLVATDGYMLLRSFVPAVGHGDDPEPTLDELPEQVAVAVDEYGRGAGLLAHLAKLADKNEIKDMEVALRLGVQVEHADGALTFDGMAETVVAIEHEATETVHLSTVDGAPPQWRPMLAQVTNTDTSRLALGAPLLKRLAKAAEFVGPDPSIEWTFQGAIKPPLVRFGEFPTVTGLIVTIRVEQ